MTLPDERYRAVRMTEQFLRDLASGRYKRVPVAVRKEAAACLRHYPSEWDMQAAARGAPGHFAERMEPLHRMVLEHSQREARDQLIEIQNLVNRLDSSRSDS
jgi:hypothetical protein